MSEKHWAMIWHQAITQSFLDGKAFGWNKTVVFSLSSPVSGEQLRLRFSNRFGCGDYEIAAVKAFVNGRGWPITIDGQESFLIPTGGICYSDACATPIPANAEIQLRIYYTNAILDNNMIEESANLLRGNQTSEYGKEPLRKPLLAKILGAYNGIPAVEAIEVLTDEPAKAIVAFGDSITALSRWTKPLARRLAGAWPGEYILLNSGITGNCLLYEPEGIFGPVFGEKGTARFRQDVLDIPNLAEEAECLKSGVDLIMPGGKGTVKALLAAYKEGQLSIDCLRQSCGRVLGQILNHQLTRHSSP